MYVSDEKKSLEKNALDAFLQSNRKLKGYTIDDGERPDFVLTRNGHKIGIEHFRADTILNEHTDSESMKFDSQRKKIYLMKNLYYCLKMGMRLMIFRQNQSLSTLPGKVG